MVQSLTFIQALKLPLRLVYWCYCNSVPIFAQKKQKWWSQTKKHATYGPALRFVFLFYIRTVQFQTHTKVTRIGSATEMKLDRSEFIFRPVPCKRMPWKKCMETDINSYRSEFVPVGRRSWQVVSEAKNAVSVAVSKLKLPRVKLKLPWHFWATVEKSWKWKILLQMKTCRHMQNFTVLWKLLERYMGSSFFSLSSTFFCQLQQFWGILWSWLPFTRTHQFIRHPNSCIVI